MNRHVLHRVIFVLPIACFVLASVLLGSTFLLRSGGQPANAGFVDQLVVNATGNTSDGDCEGPPNDNTPGGDCTFREAIEGVNAGISESIGFLPRVFSISTPGEIDIEHGAGCLPKITHTGIKIDLAGASVIIDGNPENNSTRATCQAGIVVQLTNKGFDFTLIGNDSLLIRDLIGDGIAIDCSGFGGDFALRDISITGVASSNITGSTVVDECPTPSPTVTSTLTPTATPTITTTPTITNTPTITDTPTVTSTPTLSPTTTSTPTITPTITLTSSPTRTSTPTRTRTPTNTPTLTPTPNPYPKGDANCDNVLSSIDAALILQVHAGLLSAFPCNGNPDIDHDGRITSLDAVIVLQLVAELI